MRSRRDFITLLGGAAAAWPLAARAQQGVRRVAVLSSIGESDQEAQLMVAGLHDGLQSLGWVNGRNLRIVDALGGRMCNGKQQQTHNDRG